jgi:hypothetical protein
MNSRYLFENIDWKEKKETRAKSKMSSTVGRSLIIYGWRGLGSTVHDAWSVFS